MFSAIRPRIPAVRAPSPLVGRQKFDLSDACLRWCEWNSIHHVGVSQHPKQSHFSDPAKRQTLVAELLFPLPCNGVVAMKPYRQRDPDIDVK